MRGEEMARKMRISHFPCHRWTKEPIQVYYVHDVKGLQCVHYAVLCCQFNLNITK